MVVVKQRVEKKGVVVAAEIRRSVVFVAQGWITLCGRAYFQESHDYHPIPLAPPNPELEPSPNHPQAVLAESRHQP